MNESRVLETLIRARLVIRESRSSVSRVDGTRDRKRLSPGKIHKAGSAESILNHCLRTKGWTREYKRGELSDQQHLDLLEEVRIYARAWLRHEAEQFARMYRADGGVTINEVRASE